MMQFPPQYSPDGHWWWNGYQWVPAHPPPWVLRKSPALYVVVSLFVPGLGSLLLRRWRWGIPIISVAVAGWISYFALFAASFSDFASTVQQCRPQCPPGVFPFPHGLFIGIAIIGPVILIAWILGIVDAVRGTSAWNRAHGLPE